MTERKINLVSKPLCDFRAGDTIYVKKNEGGFHQIYFCEFVEIRKGNIVAAKIIVVESIMTAGYAVGQILTARPSSCYLWGQRHDDHWPRCHWFKNTKESAK